MKPLLRALPASQAGVTLLELLTVMTIVGILASIAIPSYQRHVTRTNRSAARACMSEYAQFMERYYTSNFTYVDAAPAPGCSNDLGQRYEFSISLPPPTQRTYTVTAKPIGTQAKRDATCGTLTVNQSGQPGASGTGGVADCW